MPGTDINLSMEAGDHRVIRYHDTLDNCPFGHYNASRPQLPMDIHVPSSHDLHFP